MSIKKNYVYNVLLSGSNIVFPLITFPYVARILGPEGIGEVQFAFSYAQYFSILAAIGIPFYGIKEIGRCKGEKPKIDKVFSELFIMSFISSLIVFSVYLITVFNLPQFTEHIGLFLLCGSLILLSALNLDWLFAGLEDFRILTLRSFFIKVVALILLFILVKTEESIFAYTFVLVLGLAGNSILNLFLVKSRVKLQLYSLNFKRHRLPLVFIFSTSVATTIYSTLDTVVLGFLTDEFQVGLYTAAVKLSKVAIPLVVGLSAVMIPKMANSIESGDYSTQIGLLQKSFRFILFIATPISMGLFIFREQFILIFSGTDFLDAAQSMKYLAFLPLFIGLGYFFGFQILVPYGLNKGLFIATTGGLLFFGVLNVILTPSSGAKGTAISIFVAELMVTLFYVAFCPRKIILALSWKEMLRCIAIGLIFFPIYKLIQLLGVNPEIELVLGIIFCSGIYFSLHYYLFSSVFVLEGLQMAKSKLSLFKNRL